MPAFTFHFVLFIDVEPQRYWYSMQQRKMGSGTSSMPGIQTTAVGRKVPAKPQKPSLPVYMRDGEHSSKFTVSFTSHDARNRAMAAVRESPKLPAMVFGPDAKEDIRKCYWAATHEGEVFQVVPTRRKEDFKASADYQRWKKRFETEYRRMVSKAAVIAERAEKHQQWIVDQERAQEMTREQHRLALHYLMAEVLHFHNDQRAKNPEGEHRTFSLPLLKGLRHDFNLLLAPHQPVDRYKATINATARLCLFSNRQDTVPDVLDG